MKSHIFKINKRGRFIDAECNRLVFTPSEKFTPLNKRDIFAVDTEVVELKTAIVSIRWHDSETLIEPSSGSAFELFLAAVSSKYGLFDQRPSRTKQRLRKPRKDPSQGGDRPGTRDTIPPILSVWFNMPYDLGRLMADRFDLLKALPAGADTYTLKVNNQFEVEVKRCILGNGSTFEWMIRDKINRKITRLVGIDLTGYWKTSLSNAAQTLGVIAKQDIKTVIPDVFTRKRDEFSDREWNLFCEYALGDVRTTLELYHKTVELLCQIDEKVVRQTGIIPPSAPGAAARIAFSRAFELHPELLNQEEPGWKRPPKWADQFGCDAYYGGRVFCSQPGTHSHMTTLDIKSAYPYVMACLPDPVDCEYEMVKDGPFELERFIGKFGVLYVDGEETDNVYPSLRKHDDKNNRLVYIAGRFKNIPATIPEICIGVLGGNLKITRVRRGVIMHGSSENSFLRHTVLDFFRIKNNSDNAQPLRQMAKLLANSLYGKLVETNTPGNTISKSLPMANFVEGEKEIAKSIVRLMAENGPKELPNWAYLSDDDKICRIYKRLRDDGVEPELAYTVALQQSNIKTEGSTLIKDFVVSHSKSKAGSYFMPLFASQVTGLPSAMVGLMARCMKALQGDTDSVHIVLPKETSDPKTLPGWRMYQRIIQKAGYGKVILEEPELGTWVVESSIPTRESHLVRPKVYSHHFPPQETTAESYKQAQHGFAKLPKVETAPTAPKSVKEAAKIQDGASYHEMLNRLLKEKYVTFSTRPSPRRLREAVRRKLPVGEFYSRQVTTVLSTDPNVTIGQDGIVRWKPHNDTI